MTGLEGPQWWLRAFGQPKKKPITLAGSTIGEWAQDQDAEAVLKQCIDQAVTLLALGVQHRLDMRVDRAPREGATIQIIKSLCDQIGRKSPEFIFHRPMKLTNKHAAGYCINCGERLPLDEEGFCINCEDQEKKRQQMHAARAEREQRTQYREDLKAAAMRLTGDIHRLEERLRCKASFKTPKT